MLNIKNKHTLFLSILAFCAINFDANTANNPKNLGKAAVTSAYYIYRNSTKIRVERSTQRYSMARFRE